MTDTTKTFSELGLDPLLLQAIAGLGFETPTPIQAATIPALLSGDDVVGQAQTGTGKTAAFGLPLLQRVDLSVRAPQLLVLSPTRELAGQTCEALRSYGKELDGLEVLPVYGGQGMGEQLRALRRGVHVVVGTPGRTIDHLERGTLDLDSLRAVVLDEADEMLRMGFLEEVEHILERTPSGRQVALFSATMPPQIRRVARRFLNDPQEVAIARESATVDTVEQGHLFVSGRAKNKALARILEVEDFDGVIIFAKTRASTTELAERLAHLGYATSALNGDMSQQDREQTVERFRRGALDILVCTDVAARGLDVPRITHVINYDLPGDPESYVHRIGRAGRAGREGRALSFAGRREQYALKGIERAISQKIPRVPVPSSEALATHRVAELRRRLHRTIEEVDLEGFVERVDSLCADQGDDARMVAAALLWLLQRERPLHVEEERLEDVEHSQPVTSNRYDRRANQREQRARRHVGSNGDHRTGFSEGELYRVEVGHEHGLRPRHLVGALANEANLTGRQINNIRIRKRHATVELPVGMSSETLQHLQQLVVCGRKLRMRSVSDAS